MKMLNKKGTLTLVKLIGKTSALVCNIKQTVSILDQMASLNKSTLYNLFDQPATLI